MNRKTTGRSKHLDFIVLDLICVEIAYIIAYNIRMDVSSSVPSGNYALMNVLILLLHLSIAFFTECYSGIMRRGYWKEFKVVVIHNLCLLGSMIAVLFAVKLSTAFSRLVFFWFFLIDVVIMFVVRMTRKYMLNKLNLDKKAIKRMIVVCNKSKAKEIIANLKSNRYAGFKVKGVVIIDEDMTGREIEGVPVVASFDKMYDYVKSHTVDEVFLRCQDDIGTRIINTFLTMGVTVHINIDGIISKMPNTAIETIDKYTVLTTSINVMTFKQRVIKRTMDIIGAIFGLIFTGILTIIFAPIIYIQDPGPIFFKQERVGKNGRIFKIYKFRSMYKDAEARKAELMSQNKMQGLMFKMDNDPRITPIGKFIRKACIDEFPQFLNVLKGDMSIVGTRPPTVGEYKEYELHHKSRLAMKPGLTGMWQISGGSKITDFEEIVRLDNEYIMNFSISMDIKIICKTIAIVLSMKGSG